MFNNMSSKGLRVILNHYTRKVEAEYNPMNNPFTGNFL